MNTECVLCSGTSIACHKCIIANQHKRIVLLEERIRFLEQSNNVLLKVPHWLEQYSLEWIERSTTKENIVIDTSVLSNTYFITITFDPAKFGVANQRDEEETYILSHLANIYRQDWCFRFYGCFEQHKNGTTHAHLIMHTNYRHEIFVYLKRQFTDNPRNTHAIDIGMAHQTKSIPYIQKESVNYFKSVER